MIIHSDCKTPVVLVTNARISILNLAISDSLSYMATVCDITTPSGLPVTSKTIKNISVDVIVCPTCEKSLETKDLSEVCLCGKLHPITELLVFSPPLAIIAKKECLEKGVVFGSLDTSIADKIPSISMEELLSKKLAAVSTLLRGE